MTDIGWSGCPFVQTDPEKLGGVPTVRAFRVSADTVVENHDSELSDEEIAYQFTLPIEDAIVAYTEGSRRVAHSL